MDVDILGSYRNKVAVMRQIMSDQARRYHIVNTGAKVLTVVISAGLTFMGFIGPTGVAEYVGLFGAADPKAIGLIFNLLVLGLFILLTSHLVFHFDDKEAERWRAVVRLSQLANEVEYLLTQSERNSVLDPNAFSWVRIKYEALIEVLPGNSDEDFLRAKRHMTEKGTRKAKLSMAAPQLFSADSNRRALEALVRQSDLTMSLLGALSRCGSNLYLAEAWSAASCGTTSTSTSGRRRSTMLTSCTSTDSAPQRSMTQQFNSGCLTSLPTWPGP